MYHNIIQNSHTCPHLLSSLVHTVHYFNIRHMHLVINYMPDVLYTKFMSNGACNGTTFKKQPTSGIMCIIGQVVSFFSPGYDDVAVSGSMYIHV